MSSLETHIFVERHDLIWSLSPCLSLWLRCLWTSPFPLPPTTVLPTVRYDGCFILSQQRNLGKTFLEVRNKATSQLLAIPQKKHSGSPGLLTAHSFVTTFWIPREYLSTSGLEKGSMAPFLIIKLLNNLIGVPWNSKTIVKFISETLLHGWSPFLQHGSQ